MDFMKIVREGLSLIQEGRSAITSVKDAIADGRVALDSTEQAALNDLLEQEKVETKDAYEDLKAAIASSRK